MAIKIRCQRCSRRISIDEAFAGGVCRCPYCKTINNVPDAFGLRSAQKRPDAPPAGAKAGPRVAMRAGAATGMDDIPVADRMVFQGVATLILLGMLIAMIVAGAALLLSAGGGETPPKPPNDTPNGTNGEISVPPPVATNPFIPGDQRTVADVRLDGLVVYCIDAGGSMRGVYYYAVRMVAASVDSQAVDDAFYLIVAEEAGPQVMSSNPLAPMTGRDVERFVGDTAPGGEGDTVAALERALSTEAKTIVLFARKIIDAPHIVAEAQRQGVVIITVSLDGNEDIDKSLASLAEQTGGKALTFGAGQLQRWLDEAD